MEFINPEALPPEFREAIERQVDQHAMSHQVWHHDLKNFLESLTEDQMMVFRRILVLTDANESYWDFLYGQTVGIVEKKFGICACGEKHDAEALTVTKSEPVTQTFTHDEADADVKVVKAEPEPVESDNADIVAHTAEHDSIMEVYGLIWAHGDDPEDEWLECKGCGTKSISLADRMLRAPGVKGCGGCQHKAAWG